MSICELEIKKGVEEKKVYGKMKSIDNLEKRDTRKQKERENERKRKKEKS